MAFDVTFPSLFFAGCATLPPVKIRARKKPSGVTVHQLDLGLIDGLRFFRISNFPIFQFSMQLPPLVV